jgi:ATP-dependent DNA helicase RecG
VSALTLDGKTVLLVQIPAATRKQKPVYLNGQPLGNTYLPTTTQWRSIL